MTQKELGLNESKAYLLKMLVSIDNCCRKNGIRYSLDYGTLLGAVRHKGFIPWDDDIDLLMVRDDFEKFKKAFSVEGYDLLSEENESWARYYIRVCDKSTSLEFLNLCEQIPNHGLWIAIFPIDNVPDNVNDWKKMRQAITFWGSLLRLKHSMWTHGDLRNLLKLFGRILLKPIHAKWIVSHLRKAMMNADYTRTNRRYQLGSKFYENPFSMFENYIDIEFEGHQVMCISEYDKYLRNYYGDYMQLPPIEQRFPKHEFKAFKMVGDR